MTETIVVLVSGGGGNLRFMIRAIREKWITRWSKVMVIADRECPAVEFARREGLDTFIADFKENDQNSLTTLAISLKPDLLITNVHRVLHPLFLQHFEGRILNLHYSLLPSFSGSIGAHSVTKALAYGSRLIGATVHHVMEVLDAGRPQTQIAFAVSEEDSVEVAMDLIFRAGCLALLTTLLFVENPKAEFLIGGQLVVGERVALINPWAALPEELGTESFWSALRTWA